MQIIEALLDFGLTPSEMIDITRSSTVINEDTGSEKVIEENIGAYKVLFLPPETTNKNDGAILQQLMEGNKTREVYMVYGYIPNAKAGDTIYRREKNLYYEVKIDAFFGSELNIIPISYTKLYVVLKDNQKDLY